MIHVLAQVDDRSYTPDEKGRFVSEFTRHWDGGELLNMTGIAIAAAGLACIAAAWFAWRRHQTRHLRSHPGAVFRHVARQVGLGWLDRRRLADLARARSLSSPITLLLSPETFAHHADAHAAELPLSRATRFRGQCDRLGRRIFGPAARLR